MQSTDIFCSLKVSKVDEADFKVNTHEKKKNATWSNLTHLCFPWDSWSTHDGSGKGVWDDRRWWNYPCVAEQRPEPFEVPG